MQPTPDLASRFVTGPVLIAAGMAIYAGLFLLSQFPPKNVYHAIGVFLGAEAYAIVAGLFVLLGLQYILGPRSWIAAQVARSLSRLFLIAAAMGVVIVTAFIIALW